MPRMLFYHSFGLPLVAKLLFLDWVTVLTLKGLWGCIFRTMPKVLGLVSMVPESCLLLQQGGFAFTEAEIPSRKRSFAWQCQLKTFVYCWCKLHSRHYHSEARLPHSPKTIYSTHMNLKVCSLSRSLLLLPCLYIWWHLFHKEIGDMGID